MSKVIVIGAGLGGLTCGYILQKNGYDVTVLEQGTQIGGCLQCFYRKGAKFETGMHFIGSALPGQTMHSVMKYFDLCIAYDPYMEHRANLDPEMHELVKLKQTH